MKYRKRPVVIEAIQLPNLGIDVSEELIDFLDSMDHQWSSEKHGSLQIHTLEGVMTALPGDYIIKGVKGEFYPCKPEIFEMTYEKVT